MSMSKVKHENQDMIRTKYVSQTFPYKLLPDRDALLYSSFELTESYTLSIFGE